MRHPSIKGLSSTVPLMTPRLSELWMAQTIKTTSKYGKVAAIGRTGEPKKPLAEYRHLALMVLDRAIRDANGLNCRNPADQWDALLFLSDRSEDWLEFWCCWADREAEPIRVEFTAKRERFEAQRRTWLARKRAPVELRPRLMKSKVQACA